MNGSSNAVQPRYLGSVEAIAAAHAGRDVLISREFLATGEPVIMVELPPQRAQRAQRAAYQGTGLLHGHHDAYPPHGGYGPEPKQVRPFVEYRPHPQSEAYRQERRPPLLTHGQKTIVIAGLVTVGVLLAFAVVLWMFMAVAAAIAAYGAMIVGFAVMLLIIWILGGRGGSGAGGGGTTNIMTSITAKTINVGKIFFR